jgi:PPOX class probable F420-dependent enzyme
MAMKITDEQRAFLTGKNFASIATLNQDGSPQVSPVWIDVEGDTVIVNSEQKRLKVRNLQRDPRVAISVPKSENPYEYIEIRGVVKEITPEGGFEGIDRLAEKYLGVEEYPNNLPDDVRVVIKIEPTRIVG